MKAPRRITAITFDVGGTLIEPWPSVGHVYAEAAARWDIAGAEPEALNHGFAAAWKARKPFDHSRADWQRLVNKTFAAAGAARPSDACFDAIFRRFAQASAWRVFDDAKPALEALAARGLRLGVVSNWDERLRPLLDDLGLAKHFHTLIISCETGCTKPDRPIFLRAAAELGCEPAAMLHVGDSAHEDAEGARAAGFEATLINRSQHRGLPLLPPMEERAGERRAIKTSGYPSPRSSVAGRGRSRGQCQDAPDYRVISNLMGLLASLE